MCGAFQGKLHFVDFRMPPKQRKIAVMGSRSVGKSSLAIQFAQVCKDCLKRIRR